MSLKRIDRGHGHSYLLDGQKADGVTTLISDGLAKPALINWAANATAGYAVDHWSELAELSVSKRLDTLKSARYADRDEAGRRGTEVHRLAEQLIQGDEVDVPEPLAGHVESCVRFLDEWEPEPILTETVVAHRKWRYCGTTDGVIRLRDGRVAIYDWKTARSGIFPDAALQLAAYAHAEVYLDNDGAEQQMADLEIDHGRGIWIRSDGFDVYPLDISEAVFKDFLHVAWVARMTKRWDAWKGDSLAAPTAKTGAVA